MPVRLLTRVAACLLLALDFAVLHGGQPAAPALTPPQMERLKERDRLVREGLALRKAGKHVDAIKVLEQSLVIDREVLGDSNDNVGFTLYELGGLYRERDDFAASRRAFDELRQLRTRQFSEKDWRVTDARLELQYLDLIARLDPAGRDRLKRAVGLGNHARQLAQQGRAKESLPFAREAVEIQKEILGENSPGYAIALSHLAAHHVALRHYPEAEKLYQSVLAIRRAALTENHPMYADSLNALANLYTDTNQLTQALTLFDRVRQLRKELLPENHPLYAGVLYSLAYVHGLQEHHTEARDLNEQARAVFQKLDMTAGLDYRNVLRQLAWNYYHLGDFPKALDLFLQVRDMCRRLHGEDHMEYASSLRDLGWTFNSLGDFTRALAAAEQARSLTQKLLTENHPLYARSLNLLAWVHKELGEYDKALAFAEEARAITRKVVGEEHVNYTDQVYTCARLYEATGNYPRALVLHEETLTLTRKIFTEKHRKYVLALEGLADLYESMGDYGKALPLYEQVLALSREQYAAGHPNLAVTLTNLAQLYLRHEEYAKARPLFEQAHAIHLKAFGAKHPQTATSLGNLGGLDLRMGNYARAVPLLEQARDLRRELLGEHHPWYHSMLIKLGLAHCGLGEHARGQPLLEQAYQLSKKRDGAHSLALTYYATGKSAVGLSVAAESLQTNQAMFDRTFAVLSERRRLEFLAKLQGELEIYLTVASEATPAAGQVYDHILAWKGAVAARQDEERSAREQPAIRPLVLQLRQARAHLARHTQMTPTTPEQQASWLKRFDAVEAEKEELETRLAQESATFRRAHAARGSSSAQVARSLPAGTALVDFVVYRHWQRPPNLKGSYIGENRLLAFVLVAGGEPVCVALGAANPIEQAVQSWRQSIARYQDADTAAADLARSVWEPLRKHLGESRAVLIAPDGPLCELAFAALPGRKPGSYLIEDLAISYVTSGRQVLELTPAATPVAGDGLLAVGGLDYGTPVDGQKSKYRSLPGAKLEVEQIAALYRGARRPVTFSGGAIDAARMKQELTPTKNAPLPRFLHLATHGFFEAAPVTIRVRPAGDDLIPFSLARSERTFGRNPLLVSGLVLAGANCSSLGGTWTAEEVADLDLRGVELVVLSACDTGRGKVTDGAGVLGLQRAFQAAGARTLVASLWKVNDAATSLLMEEFYTNLWRKKLGRLEALRQAQLSVLRHPEQVLQRQKQLGEELVKRGIRAPEEEAVPLPQARPSATARSHPALWAAFILNGALEEVPAAPKPSSSREP